MYTIVLDYSIGVVKIIHHEEHMDIETLLYDSLNSRIDEIEWMSCNELKIETLTP